MVREVEEGLKEDCHQEALSCITVQEREGPAVGVLGLLGVLTLSTLSPLHELGAEGSQQGGLERRMEGGGNGRGTEAQERKKGGGGTPGLRGRGPLLMGDMRKGAAPEEGEKVVQVG